MRTPGRAGYLLFALLFSSTAHAQRIGAPPFQSLLHSPGQSLSAQVTNGPVLPATGRTTAIGGTLELRFGPVSLTAGGAAINPSNASWGWSADGGISPELCAPLRAASIDGNFHLCDLLPNQLGLRMRAAVGVSTFDIDDDDASITEGALGASVTFRAPIPTLTAEIWTEPRLHLRSANAVASGGPESTTRAGLGWSLGFAITCTSGFGISGVIDALWIEQPPGDAFQADGVGFGIALHYLR
jgi:hypothetical protein